MADWHLRPRDLKRYPHFDPILSAAAAEAYAQIPQGAPISDLLANLYLLDFDKEVAKRANDLGGVYYRYSDDILILVPGDASVGLELEQFARNQISQYGAKLTIKEEKSSVVSYTCGSDRQGFAVVKGQQCKNGLEYLGFRYDGNRIYIRNSTIQNLFRKVTFSARREAIVLAKRYPDKSSVELRSYCNIDRFVSRFGRVEDFDEQQGDYRGWTFWTYAQRAASVMGNLGLPIRRQLRRHREIILSKLNAEFDRAVARKRH